MNNTQEIKQLIKSTNGKLFSVCFKKKDGSVREMNCRMGVTSPLITGNPSSTSHIDKYVTVWDVKSNGYRNVNCETVTEVKIGKKSYKF